VVIGAGKLLPPGAASIRPGKIKIIVGKEVTVTGLTPGDVQILKQKTFETMRLMIVENS